MLWDAKLRYGRERAAARVLDVVVEDAEEWFVVVGEPGVLGMPTAPDILFDCPCFGACCRRSCSALARAFSCVRTNCARFCDTNY